MNWFVLNSDRGSNGFNDEKIKKKTKYHTKKEIKQHTTLYVYVEYIVLRVDVDTIHIQKQRQQAKKNTTTCSLQFCFFSFYLLLRLSSRNVSSMHGVKHICLFAQ